MADVSILAGATSQSIVVDLYILATGAPQTALVYNSTALTAYYSFAGATATSTAITLATLATATTAWSSGGFIKLDDTNMPGAYRFDIPNAAIAASKGREVVITFNGFSGMATRHIKIELTGWDNQDAVHGGMSALPNTAVTTNGSLLTSGSGAAQIAVNGSGKVSGVVLTDTVTTYTGNAVQTGDAFARLGIAGVGLTNLGDTRIANLDAAVSTRMATYTQPTGFLAATFPTSVASPTNITAGTITTATNLTNAPTNGDFTTAMKTSLNAATPASVTGAVGSVTGSVGSVVGAVGSVTGAVGSVSGNVGGNVVGSVASVTAAVTVDGTSPLTEDYPTKTGAFTLASVLYSVNQQLADRSTSGSTITVLKRDQIATAMTFTIDDPVNTTSIKQA